MLCSSSRAAANMLVDLSDDAELVEPNAAGAGTARLVIDQLAEIVGARNERVEIGSRSRSPGDASGMTPAGVRCVTM